MAEGFNLTTYYAKRIIGDTAAVDAEKALLQTGDGITTDTWILHRTNRTDKLYGIKYKYDSNGHDKMEYYGQTSNNNATAWIQFDTGDASFNSIFGKVEVTNTAIPSTGTTTYYFPYITGNTTDTYGLLSSNRLYLYETSDTTYFRIGATDRAGGLTIRNDNGNYVDIVTSAFSQNRTLTLPDQTGTIALLTNTDINVLINLLSADNSVLTGDDYIITQYVGGGTTTTTYHRRMAKNVRVGGLTTARSLWGNSFDGTADISGNIIMKNNNSRYHTFTIKQHNTDNTVGEMYYDSGNVTNVTSGRWSWEEWSPNSTNNTGTTGFYEVYRLPIVTTGLAESVNYDILTTKNTVTTAQGGTGVTSHTANRLVWTYDATHMQGAYHYANTTKVAINSASEPSYNFYVNGTSCYTGTMRLENGSNDWTTPSTFDIVCANSKVFKFKPTNSGANVDIGFDWSLGDGAGAAFRSADYSSEPGGFVLFARKDTTAEYPLKGSATGALSWKGNFTLYGATSTDMTASSTNPYIKFIENNTTQPVYIMYTDQDSYRAPAGLRIFGGTNATPAWLEIEGNTYFGGDGIYHIGTAATQRIIRIIDNGDQYGTGVSIGAGGLALFGSGESTATLISNLSLTAGGTETTYISSDGDIIFYPSQNSYDASSVITMTQNKLYIGVNGNTTRESGLFIQSGAGQLELYCAAAAGGNRGLWSPAHGTGASKNFILIDTNNNATFNGNLNGNATSSSTLSSNFYYERVLACKTASSITAGWRRVCKVTARQNYSWFFINTNGGWNNGAPGNATLMVNTRHTEAWITQLSGIEGVISSIRLVNVSANIFWLDVYCTAVSGTTSDQYIEIWGNVSISEKQETNAIFSDSVTAAAERTISTVHGTSCTLEIAQNITGTKSWGVSGAGGQLNGAATNGGINSIRIGDDVWLGDCNAGGMMGMKSTGTSCGFYFYNSSGTQIGQLYNNGSEMICNKTYHSSGGYLKSTLNGNTVTIGSQNGGFCHISNSADIPFWFNKNIYIEQGKTIGAAGTQYRPYQIYLGRNTTQDSKALNSTNPLIEFSNSDRSQYAQIVYTDFNNQGGSDSLTFVSNQNDLRIYAPKVHNAVWNDYAETRATDITEPGRVVTENGKTMTLANERLLPGCRIISDTYGTCMGREEDTPIAVSGRVLVYPYRNRNDYPLGAAVCSAPNGTIDIMTREEIINYPERIIGTVSEIPDYEYWGAGQDGKLQIAVNDRIWIYVR